MSCPREMRPTPMAPILICLLGANCPKTREGTMVGKPDGGSGGSSGLEELATGDAAGHGFDS